MKSFSKSGAYAWNFAIILIPSLNQRGFFETKKKKINEFIVENPLYWLKNILEQIAIPGSQVR